MSLCNRFSQIFWRKSPQQDFKKLSLNERTALYEKLRDKINHALNAHMKSAADLASLSRYFTIRAYEVEKDCLQIPLTLGRGD